MTALSLENAPVRAVPPLSGLPPLQDETPEISGVPEFSCEVCGVELTYGGRGRKPKFCDEHKRTNTTRRSSTSGMGNEKLAAAALDVLVQGNNILAMCAMLAQLYGTASAISEREDAFRVQALEALKMDPGLCRTILKAGATGGKAALAVAYGMMLLSIAPVTIGELKAKKEAREAAEQEAEG